MLKIYSFLPCAFAVALAAKLPYSECAYEPLPYRSFPTGTGGSSLISPTGLSSGSPPAAYPGVSYGAPFPTFNISSVIVGPTGTGLSYAFVPSSSDEGRSGTASSSSGTAFIPSSSDAGRSGTASPPSPTSAPVFFPNSTNSFPEAVTTIYSATTAVTTVVTTVYLASQGPESSAVASGVSSSFSYSANATTITSLVTGTVTLETTLTPSSSPDSPATAINSTLLSGSATSYPLSSIRATTTHVTIHLNSSVTLTLVNTNTIPLTTGSVTISNSSTFSGSLSGGDRSGTASPVTTSASNGTSSSSTYTASYSSGGRNGTLNSYSGTGTAPVRSSSSPVSPVTGSSSSSLGFSASSSEDNRSGTRSVSPSRSMPVHHTGPYSQFSSFVTSVVSSSALSSEAGAITGSPSTPPTLPTTPFYGSWGYNNNGGYGGYRGGYKRNGKA